MKEKKLLEGLEAAGIKLNVRSLARFTAENGILVSVKCGRRRGRFGLPPKLLGLHPDEWNPECKDFYTAHISMGQLALIPKEYDAKLNQLDTRVRRLLQENSVSRSYMPLAVYAEFKESFAELRKEYLETIDMVAENWDDIRSAFIKGLHETMEGLGATVMPEEDRKKLAQKLISSIPTAEEYRRSAYMSLEVRAFPTTGTTVDGLAPDLQDTINQTWRDDVVSNAVKAIEESLGSVFAQCCRVADYYKKSGKIKSRSLSSLERISRRVIKMNVFENPMLGTLGKRLAHLEGMDDDDIENVVEDAIVDAYAYAQNTGVKLDMSLSPFSGRELDQMLTLRNTLGEKESA